MFPVLQIHTFHEMAGIMAHNFPHALVVQEWGRLERAIRHVCVTYGAAPPGDSPESVARLIDKNLVHHPGVTRELVCELHVMRRLRNRCAHGEAPPITVEETTAFAYRAWDITSAIALGKPVTPNRRR